MKTYLVTLMPQEPYFFGNEKTFLFEKEENQGQRGNSYYIRSERTPLQSTLMGMMRYILMPYKDHKHPEQNAPVIGAESFKIDAENQSFGVIKKLSPLFVVNGGEKYVATPFDCIADSERYTPFSDYKTVETNSGKKLVTDEFVAKKGIADSYMKLSDGKTVPSYEIFGKETRVGNIKVTSGKNEKSFFKKEYVFLKNNFCFAFYAELDDSAVIPAGGKLPRFSVRASRCSAYRLRSKRTISNQRSKNSCPRIYTIASVMFLPIRMFWSAANLPLLKLAITARTSQILTEGSPRIPFCIS